MEREETLEKLRKARKQYDGSVREIFAKEFADKEYETLSGIPLDVLYTPLDVEGIDYLKDIGFPGEYPYTRGNFPAGYRTRLWNTRQIVTYGTAEETNKIWKELLSRGQTGLHIGLCQRSGAGSDHEMSIGFACKHSATMDTVADYVDVIDGIDLNKYAIDLGTDAPSQLAMFIAAAEEKGYQRRALRGSMANKVRMVMYPENKGNPYIDIVEFCTKEIPYWRCFNIETRNERDGGFNAIQEAAWAIAVGADGLRAVMERGFGVDEIAPRINFFIAVETDFLEEVAKFRAMRRMWARLLREKFGSKDPRSWKMRSHVQTSGVSLTAQQPLVNIARGAVQAVAAVLGGAQSMSVNTYDEALGTPSLFSQSVSLRVQQMLQHEMGFQNVVDPLGGSYHIEWLTNKIEEEAQKIIDTIESRGGASKAGQWMLEQQQLSALKYQEDIENRKRLVVGVNEFLEEEDESLKMVSPYLRKFDPSLHQKQLNRLAKVKQERDNVRVEQAKKKLYEAYKSKVNIMPPLIEAAKSYISETEITEVRVAALGKEYGPGKANPVEMALYCYM